MFNFKKLIMEIDIRRTDIKSTENKNTNEINLIFMRTKRRKISI